MHRRDFLWNGQREAQIRIRKQETLQHFLPQVTFARPKQFHGVSVSAVGG